MNARVARVFKTAAGAPALLLFFGMLLVPDTPNSLAERGRPDQARRVLERIRGTSKVEAEMKGITAAVMEGNKVVGITFQAVRSRRHGSGPRNEHNHAVTMARCQLALHVEAPLSSGKLQSEMRHAVGGAVRAEAAAGWGCEGTACTGYHSCRLATHGDSSSAEDSGLALSSASLCRSSHRSTYALHPSPRSGFSLPCAGSQASETKELFPALRGANLKLQTAPADL